MIPNPSLFGMPCCVSWCKKWIKEGNYWFFGEDDYRPACSKHSSKSQGLTKAKRIMSFKLAEFDEYLVIQEYQKARDTRGVKCKSVLSFLKGSNSNTR